MHFMLGRGFRGHVSLPEGRVIFSAHVNRRHINENEG